LAFIGEAVLCIAENIVLFKKTKKYSYLLKAIFKIIVERRSFEVIWSLVCFVTLRPSPVVDSYNQMELINRAKNWAGKQSIIFSRTELEELFGGTFPLNKIPDDFLSARSESVLLVGQHLIIGEYADNSARLLLLSTDSCHVEFFYNKMSGVRHIHSIHNEESKSSILVSTGDGEKVLDRWDLTSGKLQFNARIKKRLAGYTAAVSVGGVSYFGTDFSSRPNYLETLFDNRYPFPITAYHMYVIRLDSFDERYIYAISTQHGPVGSRKALSIFDVKQEVFVYCDYLDI
tara:strand:+ start:1227 stop:2090 length:864 start_codon:yes stop_codon:yes gene_type:complete